MSATTDEFDALGWLMFTQNRMLAPIIETKRGYTGVRIPNGSDTEWLSNADEGALWVRVPKSPIGRAGDQ